MHLVSLEDVATTKALPDEVAAGHARRCTRTSKARRNSPSVQADVTRLRKAIRQEGIKAD